MTISLQPVTKENWQACVGLKPRPDQLNFVAPNVFSIAESRFYPQAQMRAIYAGDALVGFVMWGEDVDSNPGEMWIWRFMIDGDQQGLGHGRAALQALLDHLRAEGVSDVFLSYEPHNHGGAQFYDRLGFEPTGRVEHGEIVVRLRLDGAG